MTLETSPLPYHRARRDHQMRVLFSVSQKLLSGRPSKQTREECRSILHEALHHGREVLRDRTLEWPGSTSVEGDKELYAWLQEMDAWLNLFEHLTDGGDDVRPGLRELAGLRIKQGLTLFHTRTRPGRPPLG